MKLTIKQLKTIINEVLYKAWSPKNGKDKNVEVEADNTYLAGDKASEELFNKYGLKIDPMTIDMEPVQSQSTRKSLNKKAYDLTNIPTVIDLVNGNVQLSKTAAYWLSGGPRGPVLPYAISYLRSPADFNINISDWLFIDDETSSEIKKFFVGLIDQNNSALSNNKVDITSTTIDCPDGCGLEPEVWTVEDKDFVPPVKFFHLECIGFKTSAFVIHFDDLDALLNKFG